MRALSSSLRQPSKLLTSNKLFYSTGKEIRFDIDAKYDLHIPKGMTKEQFPGPNNFTTATKEQCLSWFRLMTLIRRFEIACDIEYKNRKIRGFCHLYDGQEAVCVGVEASATKDDHFITAYRDHAHQLARGDTAKRVMAELFAKGTGSTAGKGGSMHMYLRKANFFGGNGIVGAQVPVGAGLAFGLKYWKDVLNKDTKSVAFVSYGDGASNQGQVFEAYNMAKLWNIPAIFICENNKYGMGTSIKRSSANTEYYTRGDYIPGIRVDGQDIFAVKEATRFVKEYALEHGPVVMEMETYRYHGHSMSDPGITYRTRDEIKNVRTTRDPIVKMRERLLSMKIATEEELNKIDEECKAEVDESVKFSEESPFPDPSELTKQVYVDKSYVVKGVTADHVFHVQQ